jgi:hypothetical protein
MNRETTYKGKVEAWERLNERLTANAADLGYLETSRAKLEAMVAQARQVAAAQAAQTAAKQQSSQTMKMLIADGDRLATVLLASVKEHYGPQSEKVAEFGLKPFRGRKVKEAPETPETPVPGAPAPSAGAAEAHPPSGSTHT